MASISSLNLTIQVAFSINSCSHQCSLSLKYSFPSLNNFGGNSVISNHSFKRIFFMILFIVPHIIISYFSQIIFRDFFPNSFPNH